jgi:hypothetical protein
MKHYGGTAGAIQQGRRAGTNAHAHAHTRTHDTPWPPPPAATTEPAATPSLGVLAALPEGEGFLRPSRGPGRPEGHGSSGAEKHTVACAVRELELQRQTATEAAAQASLLNPLPPPQHTCTLGCRQPGRSRRASHGRAGGRLAQPQRDSGGAQRGCQGGNHVCCDAGLVSSSERC